MCVVVVLILVLLVGCVVVDVVFWVLLLLFGEVVLCVDVVGCFLFVDVLNGCVYLFGVLIC